MAQYEIFVLPLIALMLIIFFPVFDKDPTLKHNVRSRRFRQVMLGRIVVAVLLFATLVSNMWPLENLNNVVFGLIISGLIMVPVGIAYIILSMQYTKVRHRNRAWLLNEKDDVIDNGRLNPR